MHVYRVNDLNIDWLIQLFSFILVHRVFPTRRRSEVETLLQKYRGDVVQAMEAMLTGDDAMPPISVPAPSPTFSMKSAFSPLVPPGVFNPAAANRYALFQQQQQQQHHHTKRKYFTGIPAVCIVNQTGNCIEFISHTNPFKEHLNMLSIGFLAAPYSGTGYLSTIIQSENDQMDSNGNGDRCGSAGESQE